MGMGQAVLELEKIVGPRKYWLHNRAGGDGWTIINPPYSKGYQTEIKVDDPVVATFVQLKLGK